MPSTTVRDAHIFTFPRLRAQAPRSWQQPREPAVCLRAPRLLLEPLQPCCVCNAGSNSSLYDRLAALTCSELKSHLQACGLSSVGAKSDLIRRVTEHGQLPHAAVLVAAESTGAESITARSIAANSATELAATPCQATPEDVADAEHARAAVIACLDAELEQMFPDRGPIPSLLSVSKRDLRRESRRRFGAEKYSETWNKSKVQLWEQIKDDMCASERLHAETDNERWEQNEC